MRHAALCCGLALAWALGAPMVRAAAPEILPEGSWTGWRWGTQQDFGLPGARLARRSFEADPPPAEAARRLAEHHGMAFDRLMVIDGGIVLSGLREGAHWLGWLHSATRASGGRGTRGMISVLAPAPMPASGFDAGAHLPAGARPLVQVTQQDGTAGLTISGHEVPGSGRGFPRGSGQVIPMPGGGFPVRDHEPAAEDRRFPASGHGLWGPGHASSSAAAALWTGIGRSLARAGWQPAEATWPGGVAWRRQRALLQMRLQVLEARSIVWIWHREEDR